ncbi:bifunctional phosphoglucose/phosphomannose isomerase [SAR202 cluster bacterium AC-409-J13_OGT_754m]|nr:bifunctional phosphoglucose/phosphomannose isomerase [SAR202 cluster bacterium AC-409-J13_OGT_754m]
MNGLSDPAYIARIDSQKLRLRLQDFPAQCEKAWKMGLRISLPVDYRNVERIVVLGMGGSAIAGDLLSDFLHRVDGPSIEVFRDYGLPGNLNENTLIIASSYSGNTDETLSGFREALRQSCKVIAITSGGIMGEEAKRAQIPLFQIDYTGEPRSALGFSLMLPLAILNQLHLIEDINPDILKTTHFLNSLIQKEIGLKVPSSSNHAKQLATDLQGRFPIFYAGDYFRGVARRWKTQFNENSKVWSYWEAIPEVHHNAVMGYQMPDAIKKLATIVLLRPRFLTPKMRLRYSITEELLSSYAVDYRIIDGRGETILAEILATTLLGDYTSFYLAILQGVNPVTTDAIDFIKSTWQERNPSS